MNPDTATASALAEAEDGLLRAARLNKRAAAVHRRQARELMQMLARLQAVCDELGIQLVTKPKEARSDV